MDGRDIKDFTLQVAAGSGNVRAAGAAALPGDGGGEYRLRPGGRGPVRTSSWPPELAGADGFIREMPEGYDTLLSERGESLSGGQRQRISIARAMLRESPILILDEPQSGLDAEAAAAVEENWRALTGGRTTFVIAHELRLVRDVDHILVLEEGRVAESGTHEELLASCGLYARLHALQEEGPATSAGATQNKEAG